MKHLFIFLAIFITLGGCYAKTLQRRVRTGEQQVAQVRVLHEQTVREYASRDEFRAEWQDVVAEITRVFAPEGKAAVDWALRCAYSESKWNAFAVNDKNKNGTIDRGVFQVNSVHNYKEATLFNYKENIKIAFELYQRRGKKPWYGKNCK